MQVLTPEDLAPVLKRLADLEQKAEVYDMLVEEHVSQSFAAKFCRMTVATLITERSRPGTLIRYKMGGKTGKKPEYDLKSLVAYNRSKHLPITREMYLAAKPKAA